MPAARRVFVDTNVILYSVSAAEPEKQERARVWLDALWAYAAGRLSWQVLHEFYANAERKARLGTQPARKLVETLVNWGPVDVNLGTIERAWRWMDEARLSYWDSLIVAAAERAGCEILLSEDFQAGRRFGAIVVVNPFLRTPAELGLPGGRQR